MIEIKTKVREELALNGKQVSIVYRLFTGPGNLLRAAKELPVYIKDAEAANGNVGHIATWLEIDGQAIRDVDVLELEEPDRDAYGKLSVSRLQKATHLIQRVTSGAYAKYLRQDEAEYQAQRIKDEELQMALAWCKAPADKEVSP